MAQAEGEITDVVCQSVATAKELDRSKQEKLDLMRRMEALTIRGSALKAQACELPEFFAEHASRWHSERRSEGHALDASLPEIPGPRDPVAALWDNVRDTHSATRSAARTTTRTIRNALQRPAEDAQPRTPQGSDASSAGNDGTMPEPDGPME